MTSDLAISAVSFRKAKQALAEARSECVDEVSVGSASAPMNQRVAPGTHFLDDLGKQKHQDGSLNPRGRQARVCTQLVSGHDILHQGLYNPPLVFVKRWIFL